MMKHARCPSSTPLLTCTNATNDAGDAHVNAPAAPPVDTIYLMPAAASGSTVPVLKAPRAMPAQFSEPQAPVANARVTAREDAGMLAVRTVERGVSVPVTFVEAL